MPTTRKTTQKPWLFRDQLITCHALAELDHAHKTMVVDGAVGHELDVHEVGGAGYGLRKLPSAQPTDQVTVTRPSVPDLWKTTSGVSTPVSLQHKICANCAIFFRRFENYGFLHTIQGHVTSG